MTSRDDPEAGGSSPCLAHVLIGGHPVDPDTARDVARFRKAERARLMALREAVPLSDRAGMAHAIAARLDQIVPADSTVAVYWPIRHELDLRPWMTAMHGRGARVLLPVVVEKAAPLVFRQWTPLCRMERGIWNILVPADGATALPDVVVSPLLGVDREGYRLGNGGGYYDRTLAGMVPKPQVIGIGHDFAAMPTIFPMPWDIPMDTVILSDGSLRHRD